MRRKKRKSGKIIFTILILAALCVGGAFVYEYFIAEEPQKPEKKPTETTEVVEPKTETNSTTPSETKDSEEPQIIGKEPTVQYEGENPNKSDSLTGAITYAGVVSQKLMIRLNIDQYLGTGNCDLSLIKDGIEYYSTSANIIADASTSTCQGFDVETTNLPSGNYSIIINLDSGDKTGTITGGVSL